MGERCADRNCVCTKAIVERGHVESPRERPLVVKATEEMRKSNCAGYPKPYLASGGSPFLPTSRI